MRQFRYVIVSSLGANIDLSQGAAKVASGFFQKMWYHDEQFQDLQSLLEEGWRPVRETAMGGGGAAGGAVIAFALVLLEREEPPLALPAEPAAAGQITPEA
jgi:hypothetical protein